MKTHRNLPFFVPFAGCPFRCLFCSQEKITGHSAAGTDSENELAAFDAMMNSAGDLRGTENQIAFFGGSFTGVPRARMIALLERACAYIDKGVASSIRVSTRPDYIDRETVRILKAYRVTDVELGVQSIDDTVLSLSGRGHTALHTYRAAELLREYGIRFTGQMMLGLPGGTRENELATATAICDMGADASRIYPTVVFEGTKLYEMVLRGAYSPLTNLQAAERIVPCLETFLSRGVRVLKIGLQSSEELKKAPFGPNDGSISELAYGLYYTKQVIVQAGGAARGRYLHITLPKGELSKLTGHGKVALQQIEQVLSPAGIAVHTDASIPPYRVKIELKGMTPCD